MNVYTVVIETNQSPITIKQSLAVLGIEVLEITQWEKETK